MKNLSEDGRYTSQTHGSRSHWWYVTQGTGLTFYILLPHFLQVDVLPKRPSQHIQCPTPRYVCRDPLILIEIMLRKARLGVIICVRWIRDLERTSGPNARAYAPLYGAPFALDPEELLGAIDTYAGAG